MSVDEPQSIYQLEVQWGDCDPADIVYYPNYYRWFDNATHKLFAGHGFGLSRIRYQYNSVGFPLVKTEATYMKTSRYGR